MCRHSHHVVGSRLQSDDVITGTCEAHSGGWGKELPHSVGVGVLHAVVQVGSSAGEDRPTPAERDSSVGF